MLTRSVYQLEYGEYVGKFFGEDFVRQVREANEIIGVVGSYVPLKRAGRTYRALCPFHNEKTPSFHVNPEKQIFHCFGCGVGGDVIGFIKAIERVEFPEALQLLAERAGIDLPKDTGKREDYQKMKNFKALLYRMHDFAASFFHEQLFSKAGEIASRYLNERGLSDEMIKKFNIGYAPADGTAFVSLARAKKASDELLVKAGLAVERMSGGIRDRFRNRLIFPIYDNQGRCVGFGGRRLNEEDNPKYLNSPETPLFSKSRLLYGLHLAKDAFIPGEKPRQLIVTEGYTDVIMMSQHGIRNTVATLGTALTKQHISLLRRYADETILLFDSDNAGQKAADRSLDLFVEEDVPAKIALLSESKDPCDYLKEAGNEAVESLKKSISESVELFEFKLHTLVDRADSENIDTKTASVKNALELINRVPGTIKRDLWLKKASERLGVSEKALRDELKHYHKRKMVSADFEKQWTPKANTSERMILSILSKYPEFVAIFIEDLKKIEFKSERLADIWKKIMSLSDKNYVFSPTDLINGNEDDDMASLVVSLFEDDLGPMAKEKTSAKTLLIDAMNNMRRKSRSNLDLIQNKIKAAEASGDGKELMRLITEKQTLARELHKTEHD